jgi:hypothetical protein
MRGGPSLVVAGLMLPLLTGCSAGPTRTVVDTLWRALKDTRVKRLCREEAEPVTAP